jgi:hypothetical protein
MDAFQACVVIFNCYPGSLDLQDLKNNTYSSVERLEDDDCDLCEFQAPPESQGDMLCRRKTVFGRQKTSTMVSSS